MSRMIFVPQFNSELRYQSFFYKELNNNFKKNFDEVIMLGEHYLENYYDPEQLFGMFSHVNNSIHFETMQINEYMDIHIRSDDYLFLSDLSFPGLFSNVLYHKKPKKCFAYVHATSLNAFDYFQPVRKYKFKIETEHSKLFDKIFVGSNYHKNKLKWNNIKVIGLPKPPFETFKDEKVYDISSVSRMSIQKVNKKLEKLVEKDFGKINRKECKSWIEYYKFLSKSKIVLLTGKEETFGYQILEAINNNSVPLAPKNFSYLELLTDEYLYSGWSQLKEKIKQILDGKLLPPEKLKNQDLVDNFYKNLILEIKD